jgi:predicted ATPase
VLTEQNARAVATICQRLDGLPLALELAAARARLLAPAQLASHLGAHPGLLGQASRSAPSRHRTLDAAIAWSDDLLGPAERRLFYRLGVFAGGFDLAAAEAVGGGDGIAAEAVLALLGHLVDASLVVAEPDPDGMVRYRLLETIGQYARTHLATSGDAEATAHRHAAHYLAVAEAFPPVRAMLDMRHAVALEREVDNLRAAMRWSIASGAADQALRFGVATWPL